MELEDTEKYFEDILLLKAFAMENEYEFLAFVETYKEDMEVQRGIDYERETDEE